MKPFQTRLTAILNQCSIFQPGLQLTRHHACKRRFTSSGNKCIESRELRKPSQDGGQTRQTPKDLVEDAKLKQTRTPWHREGANIPPVRRQRSAGAMVKGKLLMTPSRLLKLIIPLTTKDVNEDRKTVEPLALVVHPHQPLSYLERLIQSELPTIKDDQGNEKIPAVHFKAETFRDDEMTASRSQEGSNAETGLESTNIGGKVEKTGIINPKKHGKGPSASPPAGKTDVGSDAQTDRAEAPAAEHEGTRFVRWSSSTEIGDFIRDAARGKEFIVELEGLQNEIPVGVPSFSDRTYYLRQRLQRVARHILDMATVKEECDRDAHRAAQRVAIGGFLLLVSWWISVYYLTFKTNLGWDTMEPVTYLVSISSLMLGYLWFLYHNREVSYRAAMNLTISRRQSQLYAARGFRPERWEELVREGNALRAEIQAIAHEYDVDWNEADDEHDPAVVRALKRERDKHAKRDDDDGDSGDDTKDDKTDEVKEANRKEQADSVASKRTE